MKDCKNHGYQFYEGKRRSSSSTDNVDNTQIQPNRGDSSKSFTLFPPLPAELRNKIWTYACFIPRYIDVWEKRFVHSHLGSHLEACSYNKIPSLLHTCSEARSIGLQYYSLELGFFPEWADKHYDFEIWPTAFSKIYVNWMCDVICIMELLNWGPLIDLLALSPVRLIAVPIDRAESLLIGFNEGKFGLVEELWLFPRPRRLENIRRLAFKAGSRTTLDFIHFDGSFKHLKDKGSGSLAVKKDYDDCVWIRDTTRIKARFAAEAPFWYLNPKPKNRTATVVTKILVLTESQKSRDNEKSDWLFACLEILFTIWIRMPL